MRVAFDASFLHRPPSGTGVYVASLLAAMRGVQLDLEIQMIGDGTDVVPDAVGDARRGLTAEDILRPLTMNPKLTRAAWELVGVGAAAWRVRPDVLHVPSFAAPIAIPCPLVVTVHDVIPLVLPEYRASRAMRLHLALLARTVRLASIVITPSHAAAADASRVLGIPADRLRVTHEAADPACAPLADPSAVRDRLRSLGVVGRYVFNIGGFDVRKNLPLLLRAFAEVRQALDESLQLVIAGAPHSDNPAVYPPLGPLIQELGLQKAVVLTGRVTDADKVALHQGAALYVTPSNYEGFGLTALEAMACGVPTIAARRSSLPEVVGDGGLLVEPEMGPLASLMRLVLSNPDVAADLRSSGLARAAEFSWERTARQTIDAYRDAIASPLPRPSVASLLKGL